MNKDMTMQRSGRVRRCSWNVAITLLAAAIAAGGCRREGAEPPPMSLGEGSAGLAPVSVRLANSDRGIIGPIAPEEAPAAAQPGGGGGVATPEATVPIDQSTPEAAANTLVAVLNAAALSQLPMLVTPDQRPTVQEFASTVQPLAAATVRLRNTMDQRFAGHAMQMNTQMPMAVDWTRQMQVVSVTPDAADPNVASVAIGGGVGQDKTYGLRMIDNLWYVELPDVPPPGALAQFAPMAQQIAAALQSVQARLDAGEFADAQAASTAIMEAMTNPAAFVPAEGGTPPPAELPAPPPSPSPFPPRNTGGGVVPDVDSTVGPGFLNRG